MGLRIDKLSEQMRDVLAECFLADKLRDPRLQDVSITHVKLSADLQLASVYYRLYTDSAYDNETVLEGLQSCKGFLRRALAKNIHTRRVPELRFFYDESIEVAANIESLIRKM